MVHFFFFATVGLVLWTKTTTSGLALVSNDVCSPELVNSAFVFIKPHANTPKVQDLVRSTLKNNGIKIISEASIPGDTIDKKRLIDQHYYSIGACSEESNSLSESSCFSFVFLVVSVKGDHDVGEGYSCSYETIST